MNEQQDTTKLKELYAEYEKAINKSWTAALRQDKEALEYYNTKAEEKLNLYELEYRNVFKEAGSQS